MTSSAPAPCLKPHVCHYNGCSYACKSRSRLKEHQRTHLGHKPHKCSVCEKGFTTKPGLSAHLRHHLQSRDFKCRAGASFGCTRGFNTAGGRRRHERYHHTGERPHHCRECGARFVERTKLERHRRAAHTGEKPHQCQQCSYAAVDAFKLKRHIRIHTGEKPYPCKHCHMRFSQLNTLTAHAAAKHGPAEARKWYYCDQCPARSAKNSDLRKHKRIMHAPNPTTCHCGVMLPDRYSFYQHKRKTHKGQANAYKCSFCSFCCSTEGQLDAHVEKKHTEEPSAKAKNKKKRRMKKVRKVTKRSKSGNAFSCGSCPRVFRYKSSFDKHVAAHAAEGSATASMVLSMSEVDKMLLQDGVTLEEFAEERLTSTTGSFATVVTYPDTGDERLEGFAPAAEVGVDEEGSEMKDVKKEEAGGEDSSERTLIVLNVVVEEDSAHDDAAGSVDSEEGQFAFVGYDEIGTAVYIPEEECLQDSGLGSEVQD